MMGARMMWNMEPPEQREEHWRYIARESAYGEAFDGPRNDVRPVEWHTTRIPVNR